MNVYTGTEGQDDTVNILGELRVKECSEKKIGRNLDDLEDVIAEARRMLNQTAGVSRARGRTTRGDPGEIPKKAFSARFEERSWPRVSQI